MFRKKEDPLLERAQALVGAARINATTSFIPFSSQFPVLRNVNTDSWDYFVTVAGVFMGATRLTGMRLPADRQEKLMQVVAQALTAWKGDGINAFEDCKALFEREYDRLAAVSRDPKYQACDALGLWIIWNVLRREPQSEEECRAVRSVGAMVTAAFFDWWTGK